MLAEVMLALSDLCEHLCSAWPLSAWWCMSVNHLCVSDTDILKFCFFFLLQDGERANPDWFKLASNKPNQQQQPLNSLPVLKSLFLHSLPSLHLYFTFLRLPFFLCVCLIHLSHIARSFFIPSAVTVSLR